MLGIAALVSACYILQYRPYYIAFPRHVQFGKYFKGGSQLFPLRVVITLFARKKAPVAVAVSQLAPVAQLKAECSLFLAQRYGLLQPTPGLQDRGLPAVSQL